MKTCLKPKLIIPETMNFRNILIFAVAFIALIIFQREVVLPLVFEVVKSDLFLADSNDIGSQEVISNEMTDFANLHCNRYISDEFGSDEVHFDFNEKPLNAWDIGNYTYLINSELEFTNAEGQHSFKKYVCRIKYNPGSNSEGAPDYENWSIYGISGLDEI